MKMFSTAHSERLDKTINNIDESIQGIRNIKSNVPIQEYSVTEQAQPVYNTIEYRGRNPIVDSGYAFLTAKENLRVYDSQDKVKNEEDGIIVINGIGIHNDAINPETTAKNAMTGVSMSAQSVYDNYILENGDTEAGMEEALLEYNKDATIKIDAEKWGEIITPKTQEQIKEERRGEEKSFYDLTIEEATKEALSYVQEREVKKTDEWVEDAYTRIINTTTSFLPQFFSEEVKKKEALTTQKLFVSALNERGIPNIIDERTGRVKYSTDGGQTFREVQEGEGLWDAVEGFFGGIFDSTGTIAGGIAGTIAGAKTGASIGGFTGPKGALIGALVGGLGGLIGSAFGKTVDLAITEASTGADIDASTYYSIVEKNAIDDVAMGGLVFGASKAIKTISKPIGRFSRRVIDPDSNETGSIISSLSQNATSLDDIQRELITATRENDRSVIEKTLEPFQLTKKEVDSVLGSIPREDFINANSYNRAKMLTEKMVQNVPKYREQVESKLGTMIGEKEQRIANEVMGQMNDIIKNEGITVKKGETEVVPRTLELIRNIKNDKYVTTINNLTSSVAAHGGKIPLGATREIANDNVRYLLRDFEGSLPTNDDILNTVFRETVDAMISFSKDTQKDSIAIATKLKKYVARKGDINLGNPSSGDLIQLKMDVTGTIFRLVRDQEQLESIGFTNKMRSALANSQDTLDTSFLNIIEAYSDIFSGKGNSKKLLADIAEMERINTIYSEGSSLYVYDILKEGVKNNDVDSAKIFFEGTKTQKDKLSVFKELQKVGDISKRVLNKSNSSMSSYNIGIEKAFVESLSNVDNIDFFSLKKSLDTYTPKSTKLRNVKEFVNETVDMQDKMDKIDKNIQFVRSNPTFIGKTLNAIANGLVYTFAGPGAYWALRAGDLLRKGGTANSQREFYKALGNILKKDSTPKSEKLYKLAQKAGINKEEVSRTLEYIKEGKDAEKVIHDFMVEGGADKGFFRYPKNKVGSVIKATYSDDKNRNLYRAGSIGKLISSVGSGGEYKDYATQYGTFKGVYDIIERNPDIYGKKTAENFSKDFEMIQQAKNEEEMQVLWEGFLDRYDKVFKTYKKYIPLSGIVMQPSNSTYLLMF